MPIDDLTPWLHPHRFESGREESAARRTKLVVALTVVMMVAEIAAGMVFNSMALLADGWHMATHAGALGIAVFAYGFARRHADNPAFSFGTGKVGPLAGYTSAVLLGVIALGMVWESLIRLTTAQVIAFDEALLVAILGLGVNLGSAVILGADDHHHDHDHDHHDHNLRAAYLHVVADVVTSVLAIVALMMGKYLGWWWMDPAMGVVGAIVIARWAIDLMRRSGAVLVDHSDQCALSDEVRAAIEDDADNRLADLHLWQIGPGHWAVIVSVVTATPRDPAHYKRLLEPVHELSHVTVEVHSAA